MSSTPPEPSTKRSSTSLARARSFLGWAFVISIVLHALALPFLKLKAQEESKQPDQKVSVSHKVKVTPPTPPPPTPTPPPPTPPPKSTPPPVKQTNPPPQVKLKVTPPKTHSVSQTGPSENKYVAPKVGNENGNPSGTKDTGPPAPAATGVPATPAPTPVPTPTPTPKPACAVPNKDASIKGQAADADYPEIAKEQGAVGTAVVKVTLSADGSVSATSISKSAGNPALDQSAIAAAKATSYNAETVNCVPTAGSYLFQVDFTGQ